MSNLFLLDSDIFIKSHRLYHPFAYQEFHAFWKWLEKMVSIGEAQMLDSVYKELTHKDSNGKSDKLAQWVEATFSDSLVGQKTDEILSAYAQVQDYLVTCGCYRPQSYALWEPEDKADPWLIAAAKVLHATIVTEEQAANPTPSQPTKKEPKIPDVAHALDVPTMNLRTFYDASGQLTAAPYPIQPKFQFGRPGNAVS